MTPEQQARIAPKQQARIMVNEMAVYHWNNGLCNYEGAKQCALIAVGNILKALESDWGFMQMRQEYWLDVKIEIEKL
jgi:hypothetical protein